MIEVIELPQVYMLTNGVSYTAAKQVPGAQVREIPGEEPWRKPYTGYLWYRNENGIAVLWRSNVDSGG